MILEKLYYRKLLFVKRGTYTYAAPCLSFREDSDDEVYGINNLVDIYDLDESDGDRMDPGKYVVIGSCRDGDATHGEEKYRIGYFTDEQIEELKTRMKAVDPDALTEEGFWKDELEIVYSLRDDYFSWAVVSHPQSR